MPFLWTKWPKLLPYLWFKMTEIKTYPLGPHIPHITWKFAFSRIFLPGEDDYSYKLSQKFSLLLMVSVPCWLKLHAEFIKAHKKDKIMLINCQNNLRFYCLLTNIISNSILTKWLTSSCFLTSAIPQWHPHNSGLFSKVNKSVVSTDLQTDQGTTEGSSPEISNLVRSN